MSWAILIWLYRAIRKTVVRMTFPWRMSPERFQRNSILQEAEIPLRTVLYTGRHPVRILQCTLMWSIWMHRQENCPWSIPWTVWRPVMRHWSEAAWQWTEISLSLLPVHRRSSRRMAQTRKHHLPRPTMGRSRHGWSAARSRSQMHLKMYPQTHLVRTLRKTARSMSPYPLSMRDAKRWTLSQ